MSSVDWNNPEERRAYYRRKEREYRKEHPRLNLIFDLDEFQIALKSSEKYGVPRKQLARYVKQMALEAIKIGLGEDVTRPPQVPKEIIDELEFLLHNIANNINQIAYNLNGRALEAGVRPVAGEAESRRIIDEIFHLLKETRDEITSLTPNSP